MKTQLIYYVEVFFLLLSGLRKEIVALLVRQEDAVG
jgi:hypothetical protein